MASQPGRGEQRYGDPRRVGDGLGKVGHGMDRQRRIGATRRVEQGLGVERHDRQGMLRLVGSRLGEEWIGSRGPFAMGVASLVGATTGLARQAREVRYVESRLAWIRNGMAVTERPVPIRQGVATQSRPRGACRVLA